MASFRQAALDRETLELFCSALLGEDARALQVAIAGLAETTRGDGEPAFPSLGMILDALDDAAEVFAPVNREPLYEPQELPCPPPSTL